MSRTIRVKVRKRTPAHGRSKPHHKPPRRELRNRERAKDWK